MIDGRAGDCNELCGVAAIERQIDNALLIDDLGNSILLRLHHLGVSVHLHPFRRGPNFHGDINLDLVVDSQENAALHIGLKPGDGRFERIGTNRQTGEGIDTIRVGNRIVNYAGIHSGHFDLGADHYGTLLVHDTTCYRSNRDCLRMQCRHVSQHQEDQQQTIDSNSTS